MFQNRRPQWNKTIWVAKIKPNEVDEYGRPTYDTPVKYEWNVQAVSGKDEVIEFGARASLMQKTLIEMDKYYNEFKEYDVVYLDGATPEGETVNGSKANFRMLPPRNQNKCIRIYLEKINTKA